MSVAAASHEDFEYFHTLNISASGALVASYSSFDVGEGQLVEVSIDLWLEYLPRTIKCQARVVRLVHPDSEEIRKCLEVKGEDPDISTVFGMEFVNIDTEDQKLLDNFILNTLNPSDLTSR